LRQAYTRCQRGKPTIRTAPVAVSSLAAVQAIGASYDLTCAVLADRTVRCWGTNFYGELGLGDYPYADTPVAVLHLP